MADASEAIKNSIGCGVPSSAMKLRDCLREILGPDEGGARREVVEVGGATAALVSRRRVLRWTIILTTINYLGIAIGTRNLNVHKVDLEFLVGLDTDE